jgi:transposase
MKLTQTMGSHSSILVARNVNLWPRMTASPVLGLDEQKLDAKNKAIRQRILEADPFVKKADELARQFRQMVKERQAKSLYNWMDAVNASGILALKGFVKSIRQDDKAVKNALSLPWSSGQTEGHVNRLKFLKRQMYGRAKFDLLRRKVLYIPNLC